MVLTITLVIIAALCLLIMVIYLDDQVNQFAKQVLELEEKNKALANNNALLLGSLTKIGIQIQDTAKARRPK